MAKGNTGNKTTASIKKIAAVVEEEKITPEMRVQDIVRENVILDIAATPVDVAVAPKAPIRPDMNEFVEEKLLESLENTIVERIAVYPRYKDLPETYDPLEFFCCVRDNMKKWFGEGSLDKLGTEIQKWTRRLAVVEDYAQTIVLPYQIILGLHIVRLRELCVENENLFLKQAEKYFPDISERSLYNYEDAARLLNYITDKRILTSHLTTLYKLGKLFAKSSIDEAALAYAINTLVKTDNVLEKDYVRALDYVVLQRTSLKGYNLNLELYSELFAIGYNLNKTDIKIINQQSRSSKKVVKNADFVNIYMNALLENDGDRNEALESLGLSCSCGLKKKKEAKDKAKIFSMALQTLRKSAEFYITEKIKIEERDWHKIDEVIDLLQTLKKKGYHPL